MKDAILWLEGILREQRDVEEVDGIDEMTCGVTLRSGDRLIISLENLDG